MDATRKLPQYLQILGFSIALILTSLSCGYEGIGEYSFVNKLDNDVELLLYMNGDPFDGKVSTQYNVPSNDYVKFVTLRTDERGGFSEDYFINRIDSAKLRIVGEVTFIAIWRAVDDFEYAEGFESLPDFFANNNWDGVGNRIQHGGSHVEYRFTLKLQEE